MVVEILVAPDWVVYGQIVLWNKHDENGIALVGGVEHSIFQSYDGDGYLAFNDEVDVFYQQARKMLPRIEKEVFEIVARCSDGSEAWTIYGCVCAWEVLYGYSENAELMSWLRGLPSDVFYQVYQRFILCWNMAHRSPVRRQ